MGEKLKVRAVHLSTGRRIFIFTCHRNWYGQTVRCAHHVFPITCLPHPLTQERSVFPWVYVLLFNLPLIIKSNFNMIVVVVNVLIWWLIIQKKYINVFLSLKIRATVKNRLLLNCKIHHKHHIKNYLKKNSVTLYFKVQFSLLTNH